MNKQKLMLIPFLFFMLMEELVTFLNEKFNATSVLKNVHIFNEVD